MPVTAGASFAELFDAYNLFLSQTPPMPHHPAHCQTTLRRAGTLVFPLPRKQIRFPSVITYKPLLPFLWPAQTSLARNYSATASRRSRDAQYTDMGKEGKGNFQLKTPKGTRDCMVAAPSIVGVEAD
jgi:hypothetical protein